MPARPYCIGSIRLSLAVPPVQNLFAVESAGAVRFHCIHKRSGERLRYRKIVEDGGEESD